MDSRDSSHSGSRTSRRRQAAIILASLGALLLLGIGILIGLGLAPGEGSRTPDDAPATAPNDDSADVIAHSEQGAVDAATAFARTMAGPSGDFAAYRADMLALAAPQWRNRAMELADNALEFVHDRYGEGGSVSFHPARYRVKSYSEREATIEIWGLVLSSGPKLVGIEESWITGTLRLVWIDPQWKVRGQSSRGGPTPELLRTDDGAAVSTILEDFEEYESAPRP